MTEDLTAPRDGPVSAPRIVTAREIVEGAATLVLDAHGTPAPALLGVDLDAARHDHPDTLADAMRALGSRSTVVVGLMREPPAAPGHNPVEMFAAALDTTLCCPGGRPSLPRWRVRVDDVDAAFAELAAAAGGAPKTTLALCSTLPLAASLDVRDALVTESLARSMLLGGDEHRRPDDPQGRTAAATHAAGGVVHVTRQDDLVRIRVKPTEAGTSDGHLLRDGLVAALRAARADAGVNRVELFVTGGSWRADEEAEARMAIDGPAAHLVRLTRSPGLAVHGLAGQLTAHLSGACLGADVEVAAFAGRVLASDDTTVALPQLGCGLVPGHGGTVSITRRAGRWRTAYLLLSGAAVEARTAHEWGLVDELGDPWTDMD